MMDYLGSELNKTFTIKELKIVVASVGRSGSVYLAKLLTSLGFPCGHEAIFDYKELHKERLEGKESIEVSLISKLAHYEEELNGHHWLKDETELVADSSYLSVPFLPELNTKVIHLVRNPKKVINSFVYGLEYFKENDDEYHKFIYKHLPTIQNYSNPIDKAVHFYIEWNKKIKSDFFFRAEDSIDKLIEFLNVKPKKYYNNKLSNHKLGLEDKFNYNFITDKDLKQEILQLARQYGYSGKLLYS